MTDRTPPDDTVFFTSRIAHWAERRRWWVIFGGILVVLAAVQILIAVGANTDVEGGGKGDSQKAQALLEERFGTDESPPTELVIFQHSSLTVDDPSYQETVLGLMAELRALRAEQIEVRGTSEVLVSTRVVASTLTHYEIGAPREASPFVAPGTTGGDVTFATVELEGELDSSAASTAPAAVEEVDRVIAAVDGWQTSHPEFAILIGGDASQTDQVSELIGEDFGFAALVSTPLTLVIMLVAMGTVLAAVAPIVLAYAGILITLALLALISRVLPFEESYVQVVLLMGLAAGVDYGLFLLTRFRTARHGGAEIADSVSTAWNTAGRNVFIAALTTVVALCGMFFIGDPIFTGFGFGAILTIILSALVAMILLPAVTGDAMNRLRLPLIGRRPLAAEESPLNRVAGRIVGFAVRRPVPVATVTVAVLIVVAVPLFSLNLGFNGARSLSDEIEAKAAFVALEENFVLGLSSPIEVVVDAGENENVFDPRIQSALQSLAAEVNAENERAVEAGERPPYGPGELISTRFNDAGDLEVVSVPVNDDVGTARAIAARDLLRTELIPLAFTEAPVEEVLTAGQTAGFADFEENISAKTPITIAFVLVTSFIVLVAMYRSLAIGVIAVVLNALAVGAAYGLLKLVFQDGWALEGVFDFEATGIVEAWLPLFVFTITFGISMDYLTFAIGRVKEFHDRGLSTREAIDKAVRRGAGTVIMAAVVMIGVALSFAFTRFLAIQQFGFTLAVVVLIDATLILMLLLPASLRLAGERLWYLPSWLEWLPGGRARVAPKEPETGLAPAPHGGGG